MTCHSIEILNKAQKRIVAHKNGPALVIAGAGSGKTRVITHRVAQLIHSGVPASCLLYTSPSPRDRQKSRMPSSA